MIEPKLLRRLHSSLAEAVGRVDPFTLVVSCVGILIAYYVGIYATGRIHAASRWMGAMLSCTSVVTVLQMPSYREALRPALMRILGTFLGAAIAYAYLRLLPFSVVGMLLTVFMLEALCMILNIYNNGRIATITLIIIMLVGQLSPEANPLTNASLRFFESAVGVGVGVGLRWVIEQWAKWRGRLLHMGSVADGEQVDMESMPLRWGHLRVVVIASLGQLTGGALSTLIGVIIPLVQLLSFPHLSPSAQAILACSSLVGIMVGSVMIGRWSDRRGLLRYMRLSPAIILLGAVIGLFSGSLTGLCIALCVMGFGVGGGYSLDGDYIWELMPRRWRQLLVGVVKSASAVGSVTMAFACYYILSHWPKGGHWSGLFIMVVILSVVMILSSIRFAESPAWLLSKGRAEEAQHALHYFLGQDVRLAAEPVRVAEQTPLWQMFRGGNLRRTMLCGGSWACEGFALYGVTIFMPVLIMAMGLGEADANSIPQIATSVKVAGWASLVVMAGFAVGLGILLKRGFLRQQIWGFLLAAVGLGVIVVAQMLHLQGWVMVVGLMIFQLFLNLGPHLVTFLLPSEVFSLGDRGSGAGIAAAMGKAGAVVGVALTPLLLDWGGVECVAAAMALVMLLGAAITLLLGRGITTNGA